MPGDVVKVLLVEDNPGDARLMQELLARSGMAFQVAHVERLQAAGESLRKQPSDVLLLDLSLPDSKGLETVHRALAMNARIPIVVLTGMDDDAVGMEAVRLGAQDYLTKGHAEAKLLARSICYAMERKAVQQQLKDLNETLERRVAERTADLEHALSALQQEFDERMNAEKTLAESEERFRQMTEALPDVFLIASPDMKVVLYVNPAYEKVWGRPGEELLHHPHAWTEAVHPDDRPRLLQSLTQWLDQAAAGQAQSLEDRYRVLRPDGHVTAVRCRAFPIYEQGRLLRVCGIFEELPGQ